MKRFLTLLTIALSLVLINHSCKPKEEGEEFDQEFLNDVVNVVMEIEFGKVTKYKGNYQEYQLKKLMAETDYENRY